MGFPTVTCSTCGLTKSFKAFYRDYSRKDDGYYPSCRKCTNATKKKPLAHRSAINKRWRENHPDKWHTIKLAKYGLSVDDYDRILESQGGVCAICLNPEKIKGHRLSVDHDHASGHVRGLLCRKCNTSIGHLADDPALVRRAVAYLEDGGTNHL